MAFWVLWGVGALALWGVGDVARADPTNNFSWWFFAVSCG